jgi:hypothetical protein
LQPTRGRLSGAGKRSDNSTLDFPAERMLFDIDNGLRASDDGSKNSALATANFKSSIQKLALCWVAKMRTFQ